MKRIYRFKGSCLALFLGMASLQMMGCEGGGNATDLENRDPIKKINFRATFTDPKGQPVNTGSAQLFVEAYTEGSGFSASESDMGFPSSFTIRGGKVTANDLMPTASLYSNLKKKLVIDCSATVTYKDSSGKTVTCETVGGTCAASFEQYTVTGQVGTTNAITATGDFKLPESCVAQSTEAGDEGTQSDSGNASGAAVDAGVPSPTQDPESGGWARSFNRSRKDLPTAPSSEPHKRSVAGGARVG